MRSIGSKKKTWYLFAWFLYLIVRFHVHKNLFPLQNPIELHSNACIHMKRIEKKTSVFGQRISTERKCKRYLHFQSLMLSTCFHLHKCIAVYFQYELNFLKLHFCKMLVKMCTKPYTHTTKSLGLCVLVLNRWV